MTIDAKMVTRTERRQRSDFLGRSVKGTLCAPTSACTILSLGNLATWKDLCSGQVASNVLQGCTSLLLAGRRSPSCQ